MYTKKTWISLSLFWILFFVLNAIIFIPSFLSNVNQIVGQVSLDKNATIWEYLKLGNLAILGQLSGEFLMLFLPLIILKKASLASKIYSICAAIIFILLIYYNVYYEGYQSLYSVHPIFASDWIILKEILPTFFREISVKGTTYLSIFGIYLVLSGVIFWVTKSVFQLFLNLKNKTYFLVSLVFFLILCLFQYYNTPVIAKQESQALTLVNIDSTQIDTLPFIYALSLQWAYPNIEKSITLQQDEPLKHLKKRIIYDLYQDKKLVKTPNIYLLFIESYGGVATLTDHCQPYFHELSQRLTNKLDSAGWAVASNYSKSPVIGGRSWLAMTTALIGGQIDNQIQYNELIKKHTTYPHLVHFFNQQGYETYRVSSMKIKKIDTLNMLSIPNQFWKFDKRYLYPDIKYKGPVYDHFGGIPDQYTLNFVENEFLAKGKKPYFLSLITMNSHGSWSNLSPPLVEDWRQLNRIWNPFKGQKQVHSMHITDYWLAIDYQLRMVTDFILKNGKDDSIFIIMGDHNPAGLEWKLYNRFDKWATPIHILSKDSTFVNSFHQHGFTPGIEVDTAKYKIMRHKGFYSLITRQLLENYGAENIVLPEYLPWGLQ